MANLNLSQFTEKTFVADADWTFVWDTAGLISKKVSRNSLLSVGSIATSTPVTISQTWNDAAVAFTAMKIVATDTNSAAGSDFLELYSGTSTQPLRLDIQKSGQINIYGTWTNSSTYERLSLSAPTAANAIIGTNRSGGTARGLDLHTDGTARMTIGTTGNVGIGTTAPSEKLHVVGNTQLDGTSPYLALKPTSTGAHYIQANANVIGTGSGNYLGYLSPVGRGHTWCEGTTSRMMIEPTTGNVGIGTTAPSSKLQVTGGDVEIETVTSGIIMKAAGTSTRYRITLNAGGTALVFTAV